MGSPVASSHSTLDDFEMPKAMLPRFSVVGDLYIAHMPVAV